MKNITKINCIKGGSSDLIFLVSIIFVPIISLPGLRLKK